MSKNLQKKLTLVFVDESGDTGRRIDKGSTEYFIVVLVVFDENEEAEKADSRISLLKHELGKPDSFEFHFSSMERRLRLKFLEALAPYDFKYFGIMINKDPKILFGEGFKVRESFYKYATKLVFSTAKPYLSNAKVIIDGSGDRDFRRSLGTYLKKQINQEGKTFIKKVTIQRSHSNNLLQLADMVAGALLRTTRSDKADSQIYREKIRVREFNVQMWPK